MHAALTILRRELMGFLVSWSGYALLAGATFLNGLSLVIMVLRLIDEPTGVPITELYFATPFYWLVALLAAPLITMRMFAQEKFSGTFETLMTAPVTDSAVILGKYLAAWIFYMLLWVPVPVLMLLLAKIAQAPELVTPGRVTGMLLGTGLLGIAFIAIGSWTSALTKSQILAAILALAIQITLFLASFVGNKASAALSWATPIFEHINLVNLILDYARGIIDTRLIVYSVSLAVLFLTLTFVAIGSRKWK